MNHVFKVKLEIHPSSQNTDLCFFKRNNHTFFWKCGILQNVLKFKYTLFKKLLPIKKNLIQKSSGFFFSQFFKGYFNSKLSLNDDSVWKTVI